MTSDISQIRMFSL